MPRSFSEARIGDLELGDRRAGAICSAKAGMRLLVDPAGADVASPAASSCPRRRRRACRAAPTARPSPREDDLAARDLQRAGDHGAGIALLRRQVGHDLGAVSRSRSRSACRPIDRFDPHRRAPRPCSSARMPSSASSSISGVIRPVSASSIEASPPFAEAVALQHGDRRPLGRRHDLPIGDRRWLDGLAAATRS